MKAFRYRVSGRVQGVSYRASAQERARALGLIGWVRNLSDGRVEAKACGTSQALDAFEHWLWEGPRAAKVSEVVKQPEPLDGEPLEGEEYSGFEIRY